MAHAPEPATVLTSFVEGVDAIVRLAKRIDQSSAWNRPACGSWSAADVVRHELDVVGWYHGWLDRASDGDPMPAFPAGELDSHAAAGVRRLAAMDPRQAAAEYAAEAHRYAARVEPTWDLPYGYPFGTVTAGLHAGIAAAEWHLHAWDLAGALGADHRPSDPGTLLIAVTACRSVAPGGARRRLERFVAPLAARVRPWPTLLAGSGRRRRSEPRA